jgi:ribosome maturation factor RimP
MSSKINLLEIAKLAEAVASGQGYELVDAEWKHELGGFVLRVFIDRPLLRSQAGSAATQVTTEATSGVSLDDCTKVSRELSAVLDVENTIPEGVHYTLEVSSPGLNRPLKREADFQRFVGKKAKIRTKHPVGEARRNFSGTLIAVEAGKVRIDVGDQTFDVPVDDVEKANLVYEF